MVSAFTLAELEFAVTCSGKSAAVNRAHLSRFLEDVPGAAFEAAVARAYGRARSALRERSKDALDTLIAAHAITLGVTLVTNHEADFAAYPNLNGSASTDTVQAALRHRTARVDNMAKRRR